jgi:CRP-like cAMP-binding protein
MTENNSPLPYSALCPETLSQIRQYMDIVELAAGTWVMRQGERGDRFYVIEQGELEVIRFMGDGSEQILASRKSGEFIGEGSLFERDGLRTADCGLRLRCVFVR